MPEISARELPSASWSVASIESENENVSPGIPDTASGLVLDLVLDELMDWAGVHECRMVSGLIWKTMTLGSGRRNVGMNSTSSPLMNLPGMLLLPPRRATSRGARDLPQQLVHDPVGEIRDRLRRAGRDLDL